MTNSLRRLYFKYSDLWSNKGLIYKQYVEVLSDMKRGERPNDEVKMLALKNHAIKNTEFYKDYSVDDVFPVVNKNIITTNYEAMKAKDGFRGPIHQSSTSGSTGTPFKIIQDYRKRCRTIADLRAMGELIGYKPFERMIFFRVMTDGMKRSRTKNREFLENIYYVDSSQLDDANLEEWRKLVIKKKPHTIFSYPTTLDTFVTYLERIQEKPESFNVENILGTGESFPSAVMNRLEAMFACPVVRRYSSMEQGILAQDSGDKDRRYTLNTSSFYFECLKLDSDDSAMPGELGRIVITDLYNYAMPMIRYDTGDLGVMSIDEFGTPYLDEVHGKSRDFIYTTNGNLLSPVVVTNGLWGIANVNQFQFIQNGANEYAIRLNASADEVVLEDILGRLKKTLGLDANIAVEFVDEIPVLASNKRKTVICNYKP